MRKYSIREVVWYEIEADNAQAALVKLLAAPDVCDLSTGVEDRTIHKTLNDGFVGPEVDEETDEVEAAEAASRIRGKE